MHAKALAVLVAVTAMAAALVGVLLLRIDQRADRSYVVVSRNSTQAFTKAEFRATPRDVVQLATYRAEELRGLGRAAIQSDDPRRQLGGQAQLVAADRLSAAVEAIEPTVDAASLPDAARAILTATDDEIDELVANENVAARALGHEGERGDRASYALTLMALAGAMLGLAAIIGSGRPASIVLAAAATLVLGGIVVAVTAAV